MGLSSLQARNQIVQLSKDLSHSWHAPTASYCISKILVLAWLGLASHNLHIVAGERTEMSQKDDLAARARFAAQNQISSHLDPVQFI